VSVRAVGEVVKQVTARCEEMRDPGEDNRDADASEEAGEDGPGEEGVGDHFRCSSADG
jgi:hypothetical protein